MNKFQKFTIWIRADRDRKVNMQFYVMATMPQKKENGATYKGSSEGWALVPADYSMPLEQSDL